MQNFIVIATLTLIGSLATASVTPETENNRPVTSVKEVEVPKEISKLETAPIAVAEEAKIEAPAPVTTIPRGSKEDWMSQAGIPKDQWQYVDYIVSKEAGWDPCAFNPSQSDCSANPSSACGLAQSLPCGKQSTFGHWTDPVANLKWQHQYVNGKYGGYTGAYNFWIQNHWY